MKAKKSLRLWLTRNEDGVLRLHASKPEKVIGSEYYPGPKGYWVSKSMLITGLPNESFPDVTWKDNEPKELLLK